MRKVQGTPQFRTSTRVEALRREGQVLIEVMLAVIMLWAVIPHIPRICERLVGYDPGVMEREIQINRIRIQVVAAKREAEFAKARAEELAAQAEAAKRKFRRERHAEAVRLLQNFKGSEYEAWYKRACETVESVVHRPLTQDEKDERMSRCSRPGYCTLPSR